MDTVAALDGRDPVLRAAHRRLTILYRTVVGAFAAGSLAALVNWPGWDYAAVLVVMLAGAVALHLWWFRGYLQDPSAPTPTWYVLVAALLGAALWCVGIASSGLGFLWVLVPSLLLGDCLTGRRKRTSASWVVGIAVAVFGTGRALVPAGSGELAWIGPTIGAFYVATLWVSSVDRGWWLRSMNSLDLARRNAADLATARERLRLADDLHDILGHALEVVAFKSELVGRLLPPGAEQARAENDEVQRVARGAMSEVRALTRDRRAITLTEELAGAQATLGSAGIELTVTGEPTLLAESAQDVLGRVLREAMTNLLRHAQATRCSVTLTQQAGVAKLLVVNDGVPATDGRPDGAGTGLPGLERYLTERLGHLRAAPGADGTFTVDAELPVTA